MKLLKITGLNPLHIKERLIKFSRKSTISKVHIIYYSILISIFCSSADVYASPSNNHKDKQMDWFSVFYEQTYNVNGGTFVLRPFYMETLNKGNVFQASLMPLFFWRYQNDRNDVTRGFFGLYESVDYSHSNNDKDYDSGFFPLFFYGSGDRAKDRYLFIYPFGGDVRGKFAYERISPYIFPGVALFFLFPPSGLFTTQTLLYGLAALIPVYTEFEDKDYNGTALFWPLITWGKGEIRKDFRFLPFYAHNSKEGWSDNYQYLLLINYRELYLSDDTKYTFFFFPIYGKKWDKNERIKAYTVLWPFFSWGYDLDKNERIYNLPWPLVQIGDSDQPKMKKRIFFPFWGSYKTSTYESLFVTPLYFRIKSDSDYFKSEYHITCIIAWYLKRDYSHAHEYYGKSWRYFKLWPLVQAEWSDSGLFSVNVLSLLPFRDTEGYEKLYQPFWTIFEYNRKPDGEKHLGFLLRTYYQVWNEDMFKMKIPFIVNYESRNENVKEFTILLSSFGYEKDSNGAYIKLLWIPLKIGDGDISMADNKKELDNDPDFDYYFNKRSGFNPCHGNRADADFKDKFYYKMELKLL